MEPTWEEVQRLNDKLSRRSFMFNEYARFSELQFKNWFAVNPQRLWDYELVERTNDKKPGLNQELLKWSKKGKKLVEYADWNQFLEWDEENELRIKAANMLQAKTNIPLPTAKFKGWLSKFFSWLIISIWKLINTNLISQILSTLLVTFLLDALTGHHLRDAFLLWFDKK